MDESFHFFWKSPLGQWNKRPIVVGNVTYNCCEQWMMAEKARIFGDTETLKKIMAEPSPKEQQSLGRHVSNFDQAKWDEVAPDVVYRGNYAKFSQHSDLALMLADTGTKILAEASPTDRIWGIGLSESDPKARDIRQWRGKNWLGQALMKVREQLRKEGQIK